MNSSLSKTPNTKRCSFFSKFKNSVRQCSTPCNNQNKCDSIFEPDMSTIIEEESDSTIVHNNTVVKKRKRSLDDPDEESLKTVTKKQKDINETCTDDDDDELVCTVVDELSITFDQRLRNLDQEIISQESNILSLTASSLSSTLVPDEKPISEEKKANLEKSILNFAQPPPLKEFFSEDPRENEDNYNPNWDDWKSLTTDEQRYKVVKQVWKNAQIPDPRSNLTTYNWRAKNNLPLKNYKFPNLRNNYSHLKAGHLYDIFNKYMNSAKDSYDLKLDYLTNWLSQKVDAVSFKGHQLLARTQYKFHYNIYRDMNCEIGELKSFYQRKVSYLGQQYSERVQRLKASQNELCSVYNFYKGLNGNTDALKFSPAELRQWYELDDTLMKYEDIYQE